MGSTFSRNPGSMHRRGEKERLLLIAAAGLAASLVIIMVVVLNYKREAIASQASSAANQTIVPVPMGTVTLFVPDREVAPGTKLSEVNFKEVYWPRNQVPANAVLDLAEIKNQFAKANLPAGLPVQRQSLTAVAGRAGLPVTSGNRAVTIEVDRAQSIEGYTTPGSVVDVVLTYHEEGNLTSKVIVEGARVLSLGGDSNQAEKRRPGASASQTTITLDVSTQDALKIQTARQMGRLSLMLRNDVDRKAVDTTAFTADDFNAKGHQSDKKQSVCTRGTMRMGDTSYIVNCDGTMVQLKEGND